MRKGSRTLSGGVDLDHQWLFHDRARLQFDPSPIRGEGGVGRGQLVVIGRDHPRETRIGIEVRETVDEGDVGIVLDHLPIDDQDPPGALREGGDERARLQRHTCRRDRCELREAVVEIDVPPVFLGSRGLLECSEDLVCRLHLGAPPDGGRGGDLGQILSVERGQTMLRKGPKNGISPMAIVRITPPGGRPPSHWIRRSTASNPGRTPRPLRSELEPGPVCNRNPAAMDEPPRSSTSAPSRPGWRW